MKPTNPRADEIVDITTYCWLEHESLSLPTAHQQATEMFRDSVVRPALRALDEQLRALREDDNEASVFMEDDVAELSHQTVAGFTLTLASMWERAFRGMLISRARKFKFKAQDIQALERAVWSGGTSKTPDLQQHFKHLMGVPIEALDAHGYLDLLLTLASAIRHGDGPAVRKLHRQWPKFWVHWLAPGTMVEAGPFSFTISAAAPAHPTYGEMTLKESILAQLIQAVIWFWEDIEMMRCNSFSRKAPVVERMLAAWPAERAARPRLDLDLDTEFG